MEASAQSPENAGQPTKRIFLSYGRDDYSAVALRIKADLEARGHTVWFDMDRLDIGRDWEAAIELGLKNCDLLVLLMTPHSVRRRNTRDPSSRDGYCLNELAAALELNKTIIPVLLVSLEPDGRPTSIIRIQYLDLTDAIPPEERAEVYRNRFDRLIRAIEREELDFEGGQAGLIRDLKPLSFQEEIAKHVARFHGRTWLFVEIEKWLYSQSKRVFWITGKPGLGKTAIAARLCHTRREVLAYHLCKATDDDKRDPVRAVCSIAYQLSQHLPEYERALKKVDINAESHKSAQTLFHNLIVGPLAAACPQPDGPRIVIIDAIDEATKGAENGIAALIAESWESTPEWLRLIITSRPDEKEIVSTLSRLSPRVLDAQGEDNMRDLQEYLQNGLAKQSKTANADIIEEILKRSEGLFLYVQIVLEELREGRLSLERVGEFPKGLSDHYQRFFRRQFANVEEYQREIRPMLEVICAQREALPVPVLKHALAGDQLLRIDTLGSLFPLTPQQAPLEAQSVEPFHKSIRDWLTTVASPYKIDLATGESRLASAARAWDDLPAGSAQLYLLRHGVPHLVNAGDFVAACAVMHGLLDLSEFPDGYTQEQRQSAGMYLCERLPLCPPSQARNLPGEKLVDIAVASAGIDHYAMLPAFRLLYKSQSSDWPRLRSRIIQSDNWSAMYAASLVLAEEHAKKPARVIQEINELTDSRDMGEQELGLYAFKLLEADSRRLMDTARKFAASSGFLVPALVHEFLLTQALLGEDACDFIVSAGLWNTPWPYHRTQLNDIAALQELIRKCPTPFSAEPGVAKARKDLAVTLQSRDELLILPAIASNSVLHNLLRNYERLPKKLQELPAAAQPIRSSDLLDRLLLLLFGHPAWEVRTAASKIAAEIAGSRPQVATWVAGWIKHDDHRVRYAAVEAAYWMRHRDKGALFTQAVRVCAEDSEPWVRGDTADCLAEWIVRDGQGEHAKRVEDFKAEVGRLLNDTDMWPLESMAYMVRQLRAEGVDALSLLEKPVEGLLSRVPRWEELERSELQPALDELVRASAERL